MAQSQLKGDLLSLEGFDVIIHGCNCFCTMGAGIAKQIREKYPSSYKADLETKRGDRSKLGTYSFAVENNLTIVNAYTQYDFRGKGTKASYDAIRSVFSQIKKDFTGKSIAYPKIGAGLAGGDWGIINKIICEELDGENHTLVLLC